MTIALATGWGIPVVGVIVAFVLSGVSYRFGDTCYINHTYSMEVLWIPLLVINGLAVLIALGTFAYCVKVYIDMLNDSTPRRASISTFATWPGPRQVYRRTRYALRLQWRGIATVVVMLTTVIFYSVVFAFQDNVVRTVTHSPHVGDDWGFCLVATGGDKKACMSKVSRHVVSMETLIATLILLSVSLFYPSASTQADRLAQWPVVACISWQNIHVHGVDSTCKGLVFAVSL